MKGRTIQLLRAPRNLTKASKTSSGILLASIVPMMSHDFVDLRQAVRTVQCVSGLH